jgi:diguanylate cyclase (GGDEF)-like protein/PAS domain S-box-containing protein
MFAGTLTTDFGVRSRWNPSSVTMRRTIVVALTGFIAIVNIFMFSAYVALSRSDTLREGEEDLGTTYAAISVPLDGTVRKISTLLHRAAASARGDGMHRLADKGLMSDLDHTAEVTRLFIFTRNGRSYEAAAGFMLPTPSASAPDLPQTVLKPDQLSFYRGRPDGSEFDGKLIAALSGRGTLTYAAGVIDQRIDALTNLPRAIGANVSVALVGAHDEILVRSTAARSLSADDLAIARGNRQNPDESQFYSLSPLSGTDLHILIAIDNGADFDALMKKIDLATAILIMLLLGTLTLGAFLINWDGRSSDVAQSLLAEAGEAVREIERQANVLHAIEAGLPILMYQRENVDGAWVYQFFSGDDALFLGYRPDEIYGPHGRNTSLVHEDDREQLKKMRDAIFRSGGGSWTWEYRMLTRDGEIRWIRAAGQIFVRDGVETSSVGMLLDVSDEMSANQLAQDAYQFDKLTGISTRAYFEETVGIVLHHIARSESAAVLICDIDGFTEINEAYGYETGDRLLCEMVETAKNLLRSDDVLARLGPDTIGVLATIKDESDNVVLAEKLMAALERRYDINGHHIALTVSIGVTVASNGGEKPSDLLRYAEIALDRAKEAGGSTYRLHSDEMSTAALALASSKERLRDAVEHEQFELYYQPKVDVASGRVAGCEALIRWNHPELGFQSPAEFIPLAESTGLIVKIGEWVVRAACRQHARWHAVGFDPGPISVNVSPIQFARTDVPAMIRRVLKETGVPGSALHVEITESAMVSFSDEFLHVLEEIRELGIEIELDDFGTGYSSLSYLRRLPLSVMKVDQCFVRGALTNSSDAAIVHAVIQLAREFGLRTIAEGAETPEQVKFLKAAGADSVQGYFFSKPLPAGDFAQFVNARTAA